MRKKRISSSKSEIFTRIKGKDKVRTNITLRLPEFLIFKIDKECKKEKISRTQLIEELLLDFLGA
jgi:hypothetical protein